MSKGKIKRALISVYDKTGIVDFARALSAEFGIEIISTGGTAKLLKENGIPVTLVEEVTGFPEMMDGRVKTLHPKIHAAILADRDNPEHMRQLTEQDIEPIDMVVVNLYPFEKTVADPTCTFDQAIEMIDIGGPCLLRAAAKNHEHVIPVTHLRSYDYVLEELAENGDLSVTGRMCLASIVYERTAEYDDHLDGYLTKRWTDLRTAVTPLEAEVEEMLSDFGVPKELIPECLEVAQMRVRAAKYGENPHQAGALTRAVSEVRECNIPRAGILSGEPSYNNYADSHAALELCKELTRAMGDSKTCVFVKHTNACGVGVSDDFVEAYRRAYLGDPNAAMGGVLCCNFDIDAEFARTVMETYGRWGKEAGAGGFFVEVWIAPSFADDAVEMIRKAKKWGERVRLLSVGDMEEAPDETGLEYRSIAGGMLMQTRDLVGLDEDQWKTVTKREPTEAEMADLRLTWLVCKHTKSNAITICKDNMLIGNGAGQMSRVMSCRIATWLAKENGHEDKLAGAVAASDAFFPFRDGPDILMDAGVTAIIQPGGSKRDADTIAACDERSVAMIFTGTRHFRH
jgi:phosphoribosylaminoimidazolecarboxamide formyltransferase/IMP cyclohydrolase